MANTNTPSSLSGTRTEQCIVAAYLSESAAYTRYTFYAQQAQKEEYYPVAQVFNDTAANELHHAKVFFRMLQGGKAAATLDIDAGVIGTTAQNLATAVAEEQAEGVDQYEQAAAVAREEGFEDIAEHFLSIAKVEKHHKARFEAWLKHVSDGTVWKRDHAIKWRCLVCGFIFEGTEPPQKCPACDHPYQHYMALDLDA